MIEKRLGIEPYKENQVSKLLNDSVNNSAAGDFEKARANLLELMDASREAITELSQVAKKSQHPRAYEVLAKLIDTSMQSSKNLLDLQEQIKEIDSIEQNTGGTSGDTINNNLILTTTEFQRMIKENFESKQIGNKNANDISD